MADYRVATINLGVATGNTPLELAPPGTPISKITIRKMPLGAAVLFHFGGPSKEGIDLITQGERFGICPAETNGVYVTVPVAQAGQMKVILSSPTGEVDSLGVGAAAGGDPTQPQSPVLWEVETPGSLNGPAFIQISNPVGSGRLLKLRKLFVFISTGNIVKVRRTNAPINIVGAGSTIVTAVQLRMDERDLTTIKAIVAGSNFTVGGASFLRAAAQWQVVLTNPVEFARVREPDSEFPIYIKEGSAVEISADANGAGIILRAHGEHDEE